MQPDKDKPVAKETPTLASKADGEQVEAQAQWAMKPLDAGTGSLPDLKKASEELKAKIAEAKRRSEISLDSAPSDPGREEGAAEGHGDIPNKDGD